MDRTLRFTTIATAGHVDHGKTSLLKALTGVDADRLKEERERQMTIDLGFAPLMLTAARDGLDKDTQIGFIDVPGHGKFLKNMLAGVGGVDIALLVVAADEGVMPQTRQHVRILSVLGVSRIIVALTKMDMIEAGGVDGGSDSVAIASRREAEIRALLAEAGIECITVVPVSSTTGSGIDALRAELAAYCKAVEPEAADALLPAYLPIDRVFSRTGFGTVVTGTLVSGTLVVGDTVRVEPGGLSGRVRGLESFGRKYDSAACGQRLAVNLVFKAQAKLERGLVICGAAAQKTGEAVRKAGEGAQKTGEAASHHLEPTNTLLVSLQGLPHELLKIDAQKALFYNGTAEVPGYIRWVESVPVSDGQALFAQIALDNPAMVRPRDRFVVRYGDSIAGGVVLTTARPRFIVRAKVTELCQTLLREDFARAAALVLELYPRYSLTLEQMAWFVPPGIFDLCVESYGSGYVEPGAQLVSVGRHYFERGRYDSLRQELSKHAEREPGLTGEALRLAAAPLLDRQLMAHFDISSPPRSLKLDLVDVDAQAIVDVLKESPIIELKTLSERTNRGVDQIKKILVQLAKSEQAYLVEREFVASRAIVDEGHCALTKLWQDKGAITPGDLREAMGLSRKYIMPLLTHYDDTLVTRRVAGGRVLLRLSNGSA